MKEIYLAGGCFWGVEKYMSLVPGVTETEVGFANGHTENPTYEQVKHEHTGHAETVRVVYDPRIISLPVLLALFFRIIDPTSINRQGEDRGEQYRTGIYYLAEEDREQAECALDRLQGMVSGKVAVELAELRQFFPAEEYHRKYLEKNPGGYCHVSLAEMQWIRGLDVNAWAKEQGLPVPLPPLKMMIVMRRDLGMRKGKIAAQAGHACVEAVLSTLARDHAFERLQEGRHQYLENDPDVLRWLAEGEAKVCVYVDGEERLTEIQRQCSDAGILSVMIHDAGRTEFHGAVTATCLATEPVTDSRISPITGNLPLY